MSSPSSLLLEIWKEVSRQPSLEGAIGRIAALAARRLPLGSLLVRRVDLAQRSVETLASGTLGGEPAPRAARSELDGPQAEALVAFTRSGRPLHRRARALAEQLPGAAPSELEGDLIAAPLAGGAFLLLAAARGRVFEAAQVELALSLCEPIASAYASALRMRALASQQAAAEADRLSLLSRLGRSDLAEPIVGAEAGLRDVFERVDRVAASDVPVLVLGETGSGKEVVARAIHQRSPRAGAPFHRVNCGAIPSGLVDSELFGHERGSFTGAAAQRKGWFERAEGGTLFLDEVGELPLAAQVRLLRILQDGSYERVGGQRALHADVRIVAATHRDLRAMVAAGEFREDLWYRIAVFPIELPPLRERPEDIPALASHFALRAATRFGTPPRVPTRDDLDRLVAYPWPGNVRELGAVIERAVILGEGDHLDVATALGAAPVRRPGPAVQSASLGGAELATLDEAMREHIERALEHTRGRVEGPRGAAKLLAINPHTLRARMRKLRIDWERFR